MKEFILLIEEAMFYDDPDQYSNLKNYDNYLSGNLHIDTYGNSDKIESYDIVYYGVDSSKYNVDVIFDENEKPNKKKKK